MDEVTLRKLVIHASPQKLADAMSGLSEKERRGLSTYANKLRVKISRGELDKEITDITLDELLDKLNPAKNTVQSDYDIRFKSQIAVVGLSSLTNAKRIDFWSTRDGNEKVLDQVVRDRKPEWLTELVIHDLEKEFGRFSWPLIYGWIEDGLCEPVETQGYYEQFSMAFHGWEYQKENEYVPISQRLAKQPALLKHDVWGLFKYTTLSFQNDWHAENKNGPKDYETWPEALKKLSEQNLLDKSRLLDESLAALEREFEQHIKSGFHKFHVLLEPTIDEIEQRKESYLDLLSQPVGHIINFAIKMLRQLEKAKRLGLDELLPHVSPVMSLPSKTQPIAILKMIKRLSGKANEFADEQLQVCVNALHHESKDVQELALSLLETIHEKNPQTSIDVERYIDFLHPALKSRLQNLSAEDLAVADNAFKDAELDESWQQIIDKIKKLDIAVQQQLGLSGYENESFRTSFPPPLNMTGLMDAYDEAGMIEPINSVEDLILAVSHAVEIVDSADEVERILDGISRLCDQHPDDFSMRTEALKKRIADDNYAESARGLVMGYDGITTTLNDVLHTWLTGNLYKSPATNSGVHEFIEQRLHSLAERVSGQVSAPLLAAPTHQHGWIDPEVFVSRVLHWQERGLKLDRYDLVQALLRLAFIDRDKALVKAGGIKLQYYGPVIRWALGGDNGPESRDKKDSDLWIMAACCRRDDESLTGPLEPLKINEFLPDSPLPAVYQWKADNRTVKGYADTSYTFPVLRIDVQVKDYVAGNEKPVGVGGLLSKIKDKVTEKSTGSLVLKQLPTCLLNWFDRKSIYENANYSSNWLINWTMFTWPANIDGSMARAARHFVSRIDEKGSSYEPNYAFLEPVFLKDKPWSEMVRLALWTALISMDADAKGIAVDLLIQGIEDGRAHPDQLSGTLSLLSKAGWIKLNRLSQSLSQVADVSLLHKLVCLRILEPFVEQLDDKAKNAHQLMELMLALYIELGLQPKTDLVEKLREIKGSSKKARAAKALLSVSPDSENNHYKQAIIQAVEQRINHNQCAPPSL